MIYIINFVWNFLKRKFIKTNFNISFLYLFIMNKIDVEKAFKDIDATIFYNYIFAIFTLSLIAVLSLFSVIYLLISIYLVNNYKIEDKFVNYPRIIRIIKYSMTINKFWVAFELLLVLISLLIILISSFLILDLSIIL